MKTKLIMMTLCVFMMLCTSACSGDTKTPYENDDSSAAISESEDIEAESTEENVLSEDVITYQTEETKQKMRDNNKNKIKVKCIDTGIIYDSIHNASILTKIAYQNIYKVCKGKRKTAGGYN